MPDEAPPGVRTVGLPLFCLREIAEPAALDRIIAAGGLSLTDDQRAELGVSIAHDAGWFLIHASASARALRPVDVQDQWQQLADAIKEASKLAAKTRGSWPIKENGGLPGMTEARRDFLKSAGELRAKALQMVELAEPIVQEDQAARHQQRHQANAALDRLVCYLAVAWRDATGAWPGASDGGPFSRFVEAILVETRRALPREDPDWRYSPSVETALTATPGAIAKRLSRLNKDKYPSPNF